MKILLTGGGSGGHLIPLLGIVFELRKICNDCNKTPQPEACPALRYEGTMEPTSTTSTDLEFLLIAPVSDFNKSVSDAGIKIKTIKAGKLRRYFSWENFKDILKIPVGIIQSLYYIHRFKPDAVFSKGGFASIPPVIASWILKVPIITHESDIVPGLANCIIARLSSKILISFSAAEKYFDKNKVILTGNPIRSDITQGDCKNALKFFKLSSDLPTILIFGGSQGAQKINEMVLEILSDLTEKCQVIHQCGDKNYEEIKNKATQLKLKYPERYRVYPFIKEEMKDAYALTSIVISRAGANSLAEIVALQKPNILIPLSTSANDHQFKNAKFFLEKNASLTIDETANNSQDLANTILKLLSDKNLQKRLQQNLSKIASPQNASRNIAEEIIKEISLK
ncbi:MAG: undecaprenyldiphospho-muramoylpentapeptide beta-N-acetylglucosaminyltransferase [Patescibacteria group bacterium]|nr:undecaprenyldiphospho-muramoylpentapeptide beta-N-acetylglucosaminyltransferase [Patescibacteria group bacterium]